MAKREPHSANRGRQKELFQDSKPDSDVPRAMLKDIEGIQSSLWQLKARNRPAYSSDGWSVTCNVCHKTTVNQVYVSAVYCPNCDLFLKEV